VYEVLYIVYIVEVTIKSYSKKVALYVKNMHTVNYVPFKSHCSMTCDGSQLI